MPNADVIILPEGSPCTRDYRITRVRVFVDSENKVVSAPHVGWFLNRLNSLSYSDQAVIQAKIPQSSIEY